jgi:uncharacterized protein
LSNSGPRHDHPRAAANKTTAMRRFLLTAIRVYQRYVSPYKGFCCAYRQHTGGTSCSTLGYRAVRRHGVFTGLGILRKRTHLCGVANRRHAHVRARPPAAQRGDCDPGCDSPCDCDLSNWRSFGRVCDVLSCCDCCDWPDRKRKHRKEEEQHIYIPPKTKDKHGKSGDPSSRDGA